MNNDIGQTWALVLAAGEGTRLRTLTTTMDGAAIPKQFCSLRGGHSLLEETLFRATAIADPERICAIVAQQHRRWWEGPLRLLRNDNVIVQPANRGTANGILLPLLHILERDPEARIVLLPSDHHVRDEALLSRALVKAVAQLRHCKREVILLGVEPEEIDPDLGYVVPGSINGELRQVERFVEKPAAPLARELIGQGALWNVFIIAARASALLNMFITRYPNIVDDMRTVVAHDALRPREPIAASHLYKSLPDIDFSRHIAQGYESALRVLPAPACGWSDLGTPARVAQTLARIAEVESVDDEVTSDKTPLNLAIQYARLHSQPNRRPTDWVK